MAAPWPLVGRDDELARISDARERGSCGVVISAAAGVGKTRLGREALAVAERDGALTQWVQATTSARMIPLGAFAGLLADGGRADEPLALLRGAARVLHDRARGRKIVLGVDDAQLLDPISATLVLHLATSADVFVLATVRTGEPCPDAIVSLWKDAGAQRLPLVRLSDEAVRALVETALDGPVEERALRWVVDRSQGNPLYARELVLDVADTGALDFSRGLWRLSEPMSVGASLVELVEQRVSALTTDQRATVELLALGEPLRLSEIATLTSDDALSEAEGHGLIAIESGPGELEIRLAHPLYGDVLRAQLSPLRGRALRLGLAAVLQQRDPLDADDALRVVRLLLDCVAPVPPRLLVSAARAANLAGDPELGAQLAELALRDGADVPAALALARAHAMSQRFEQAEAVLAAVEGEIAADPSAIDYLEQRIRTLYLGLNRVEETAALLDRARSWSAEPAWHRRLVPLSLAVTAAQDPAAALAVADDALADADLDAETRQLLEPRYAVLLLQGGRWSESDAIARRYRPTIPIRDPLALITLALHRCVGVESGADWPDLEAYLSQALSDGVRTNDHEAAGQGAVGLGHLHFLRGRFRDAVRWLAEAELHFEREDAFGSIIDVRMLEVGIAALTGDVDRADAALERAQASGEGPRPRPTRGPYLLRAEGWADYARSPAAGAAKLLSSGERLAGATPGFAALLAYDALVAGASATRSAALLAGLAPRCRTQMIDAYAAHAVALASRDGQALLRVVDAFEAIGALRYAMTAAAHAASAFVEAGRQDSARRAAVRAGGLHQPGQWSQPPEIDGLDQTATALTARESQLAGLARSGLTNAQIADQLVLSIRTVEVHLYRAMRKLGLNDRREL